MAPALLLVVLLISSGAQPRFVQGDVLRVRARPSASAPVVARVSINSALDLLEQKGEWARVRTRSTPPVTGWALALLLGEHPVNPKQLREQLGTLTGAARLTALERLAAAEPEVRELQGELRSEYLRAGKPELAKQIEARLAGKFPTYLASCVQLGKGRFEVVVVASFSFSAGWVPLLGADLLEPIAAELGGLSWLMLRGGASVGLTGSPFPAPAVQTFSSVYGSEPAQGIRLGTCSSKDVGWSYLSGPLMRGAPLLDDPRVAQVQLELEQQSASLAPLGWARQVYGEHTFAVARYSARNGAEGGVMALSLPPAPQPVARLALATSARLVSGGTVYLAAGTAWESTLLAAFDAHDGSLRSMIPTIPTRSGSACKKEERDTGGFSQSELESLSEFDARTAALERLPPVDWFNVGGAQPRFLPSVEVRRQEIRCTDFPDMSAQLVLGGWTVALGSEQRGFYATAALRSARAPDTTSPSLAEQINAASAKATGAQVWLSTREGLLVGFLAFDEVTCESTGEDSICGGDTGYVVVVIRRGGKSEAIRVVTSTTGC